MRVIACLGLNRLNPSWEWLYFCFRAEHNVDNILWGQNMNIFKSISAAFVISLLGAATLPAQTLRSVGEPAKFPPSSFAGKQYVDSRGCVYIRAGISGNTTWVPRVARNRTAVCGFQPTLVKRTAPTATTPEEAAPTQRVAKVAKPAPLLGGLFAPKPLDIVASIKAKQSLPRPRLLRPFASQRRHHALSRRPALCASPWSDNVL